MKKKGQVNHVHPVVYVWAYGIKNCFTSLLWKDNKMHWAYTKYRKPHAVHSSNKSFTVEAFVTVAMSSVAKS